MKKIIIKTICWFIFISYLSGCTTTEIIQYKAELNNSDISGDITVVTKDSAEYTLKEYKLVDSLLYGTGNVNKNDINNIFNGKININDIVSIEGEKVSIEKTIIGLGVVGLFLIAYANSANVSDDGAHLRITLVNLSGSSGCL